MKRQLIKICLVNLLFWMIIRCHAQQNSWKNLDSAAKAEFLTYDSLNTSYYFTHPDSTLYYGKQLLHFGVKNKFIGSVIYGYTQIGYAYWLMGNYPPALEHFQKARQLCETHPEADFRNNLLISVYDGFGCVFCSAGFYKQGFESLRKAKELSIKINSDTYLLNELNTLGDYYEKNNQNDSAFINLQQALKLAFKINDAHYLAGIYKSIGNVYYNLSKPDSAIKYWRKTFEVSSNDFLSAAEAHNNMGKVYLQSNTPDSAHLHITKAIKLYSIANNVEGLEASNGLMTNFFKKYNNEDSFYHYLQSTSAFKDSLLNKEKRKQLNTYALSELMREQQQLQQQKELQNKIKLYSLLAALGVFLLVAFLLYRNNRHKQKANVLLQQQKQKVESTLSELKSTQQQLIQSEKMASLGELTAGIAHEIQNPLNFVNNFSEVNNELIDEMNGENDINEIKSIAVDLKQNNEKIAFHGRRADAIVKGMLQHSRQTKGAKEPTDINALCDEYLRLSYHGLRAKDKSFNADFKTDFDESIGKINIVPQDIGRVLLNLFNNAFYATSTKASAIADGEYKPLVSIQTKKMNDKVEIKVSDNGNGIPSSIIDKIFQPFFTTKPTGQGTGLGLSLAYNIVTKEHNGSIKVESKEGEGSWFIIKLPISIS